MSDTVHYKGRLKEIVPEPNETLQQVAKKIFIERANDEYHESKEDLKKYIASYEDDYLSGLSDEYYNEYVRSNKKLYEIIEKEKMDDDNDIFNAHCNSDGTINFEVMYYNGGCGFDEAIDEALSSEDFKVSQRDSKIENVLEG